MMRLRNAVSTTWRMGNALAQGAPAPLDRIKEMRAFTHWLATHEQQLQAKATSNFGHQVYHT
jgi:hypothetical protein